MNKKACSKNEIACDMVSTDKSQTHQNQFNEMLRLKLKATHKLENYVMSTIHTVISICLLNMISRQNCYLWVNFYESWMKPFVIASVIYLQKFHLKRDDFDAFLSHLTA